MKQRCLILVLAACLALAFGTAGCDKKENKYKDEIAALDYVTGLLRTVTREIDRAPNELAIHGAVIEFMSSVRGSKANLNKLEEQYPDFKVPGGAAKAPKEMQPALKKFQAALMQLRTVVEGKKSKYARNKSVMERFNMLWGILYHY